MKQEFAAAMRRAARATRARDLGEATRIIQGALSQPAEPGDRAGPADRAGDGQAWRGTGPVLDLEATVVGPKTRDDEAGPSPEAGTARSGPTQRPRRPLREVVAELRRAAAPLRSRPSPAGDLPVPEGASFTTRSFTCPAGTRSYRLYRPSGAGPGSAPTGLVVMLHGCQQDPDDFARGTNMNALAEAEGLLVAYPAQTGSDNAMSCWNWFEPGHQVRGAGEPAIIAGITGELVREFGLDRRRVFVAGLSAGGAMAVVMGETYPELYAAVGAHSALPYGAARDMVSAFGAMRGQGGRSAPAGQDRRPRVRTIVFHGSADTTVHPSNGDRIAAAGIDAQAEALHGRSAGGRPYSTRVVRGPDGAPVTEHWLVEGAGHAWAGGSSAGSFTDPHGPDASREMLRFFLAGGTDDR